MIRHKSLNDLMRLKVYEPMHYKLEQIYYREIKCSKNDGMRCLLCTAHDVSDELELMNKQMVDYEKPTDV